jgi:DNA replication protein DnaC
MSFKFEVVEKIPLSKGTKLSLQPNENFQIMPTDQGPELLVTKIESKPINIELTKEEKISQKVKEVEDQELEEAIKEAHEFKRKWQIKPGAWWLHIEKGFLQLQEEQELYFETKTSNKLLHLLRSFMSNNEKMLKYKKTKRSYLLHSDPGMGKSALIRHFCREALKTEGTSVIKVSGDIDFNILQRIFLMEYNTDVKYIILVIEDFGKKDWSYNQNLYNPSCLNFLDGNVQLFRVPTLILTTTNFAKELGNQLTSRPGRFNKIIKVVPPTDEEVFELAENYLNRQLTEDEKRAFSGKEFSPDYCLEAIIRSDLEEIPIASAIEEILEERQGIVDWNKE